VSASGNYEQRSGKVHRIVGGVMGLIGSIEKGAADVTVDIDSLKGLCSDDEVIVAALESVKNGLASSRGRIPSLAELQQRFGVVKKVGRKMSMVGEGPGTDGLQGLVAGEFYSRVLVATDDGVAMKKLESEGIDDEERLARASYQLSNGHLVEAAKELDQIKSKKVKVVIADFLKDAKAKVSVEECVDVLKLRCSSLNTGMQ